MEKRLRNLEVRTVRFVLYVLLVIHLSKLVLLAASELF